MIFFKSLAFLLLLSTSTALNPHHFQGSEEWSGWGGNIFNNRWASEDAEVSSSNIHSLVEHCRYTYEHGVSATPVISRPFVYYPTWSGLFVALNYVTCAVQWQINVTDIVWGFAPLSEVQANVTSAVSRTSPQLDGDVLFFGTHAHALLVAVNRHSGTMLGVVQINTHPLAIVTMSPTVYEGKVFAGSSSMEESAASVIPGYQCCSFVGNLVAMKFNRLGGHFDVQWNISTLPEPRGVGGWSGGAIWGSQPSIDPERGQVFIATGNVYAAPAAVQVCQNSTKNESACLPANAWQESVLAIDIDSGNPNWVHQLTPLDAWTLACGIPGVIPQDQALCPGKPGPDADFGMAPAFVPRSAAKTASGQDVVVVGQKNGNLYSLAADSGTLLWSVVTGPGSAGGGLSWGIAVDDSQVYFTAINSLQATWQLQPSNVTVHNSAYGAAKLADGSLLWETQTPQDSLALSPPSVVNDIIVVGRNAPVGQFGAPTGIYGGLVVLAKTTGKVIAEFDLDNDFYGGVAIQNQYILFGTGYNGHNGTGSFYVMSVRKKN
ncbi:Quino protein alcohol dehydrogenase-like protein [Lipomyces tetrasporus]|uniref:Quino protein alcohol dehydrogenase-like protein n=1 Tax=Lipomyces tetrasporus TaxID=54092 RepID=A0AAD7QY92_9ASCO|nr:Quino protein alcohol dehydrogenase-like protein [Lipomyces tetrasporus]KAJ8103655.1 Quino protein alcohol dehydrogenase-like protein [Lipomyces tetrasporus]